MGGGVARGSYLARGLNWINVTLRNQVHNSSSNIHNRAYSSQCLNEKQNLWLWILCGLYLWNKAYKLWWLSFDPSMISMYTIQFNINKSGGGASEYTTSYSLNCKIAYVVGRRDVLKCDHAKLYSETHKTHILLELALKGEIFW